MDTLIGMVIGAVLVVLGIIQGIQSEKRKKTD